MSIVIANVLRNIADSDTQIEWQQNHISNIKIDWMINNNKHWLSGCGNCLQIKENQFSDFSICQTLNWAVKL